MITRMSTKGQVVIPRKAREALGVEDGTAFSIRIEGDGYRLVPQRSDMREWLAFAATMGKKYPARGRTAPTDDASLMDWATAEDARTQSAPKTRRRGSSHDHT